MSNPFSHLELRQTPRRRPGARALQERSRFAPWLSDPLWQLDFVVDGTSLLDRVLAVRLPEPYGIATPLTSVADSGWPHDAAWRLQQLSGQAERDQNLGLLAPARLPLYGCPECGDLECGMITVAVRRSVDMASGSEMVHWVQVRFEDGYTSAADLPDLSEIEPLTFAGARYDETLAAATRHFTRLAQAEQEARARFKAGRSLRSRLRRLLRR